MSDTLHYTKVVEGIKGFINKKRKENPKSKVVLKVIDQSGDSLTYEKAIPEYSVIDQELLFPDLIKYEISIDGQVIKQNVIKDISKSQAPQQTNNANYPTPPALENNAMQFMFSMMQQSNSLLAESQRANMQTILETTTKNAEAQSLRNLESFKAMLEIEQAKSKNALEMEREKFKFELDKRETLEALGKDNLTLTDVLQKATGFLEKVPMPIWAGIFEKLTGRVMPIVTEPGETSDIVDGILNEVKG